MSAVTGYFIRVWKKGVDDAHPLYAGGLTRTRHRMPCEWPSILGRVNQWTSP